MSYILLEFSALNKGLISFKPKGCTVKALIGMVQIDNHHPPLYIIRFIFWAPGHTICFLSGEDPEGMSQESFTAALISPRQKSIQYRTFDPSVVGLFRGTSDQI